MLLYLIALGSLIISNLENILKKMLSIPVNLSLPSEPRLVTALPGHRAQAIIERDRAVTSPS